MSDQRHRFRLPANTVYLDGNSLGPPLISIAAQVNARVDEWAESLIGGWNQHGWMSEPERVGDRIASLVGAADGRVTVGDTLSVRLYQALAAALALQRREHPERRRVLTDSGNFPSDLYIARSLLATLGSDYELLVVEPQEVTDALDDSIAVLMLTEVDYCTARRHDMQTLTASAHSAGVRVVWDLAHSAGAFPVFLEAFEVDFAVGCTYKYLNGGPGAPAFVSAGTHVDLSSVAPIIAGWLGHAAPFAFESGYRSARGVASFRIGTPPVLAMRALDAALDVFDEVSLAELQTQSQALSSRLIEGVTRRCPALTLVSPRDAASRGSHVSFACDMAYPVMQALITEFQVIGDVRAPNLLRFGIAPLYVRQGDIDTCVDALVAVLDNKLWDRPAYHQRQAVT